MDGEGRTGSLLSSTRTLQVAMHPASYSLNVKQLDRATVIA
jgi:hypothetical protein